jgi:hypothetical protein
VRSTPHQRGQLVHFNTVLLGHVGGWSFYLHTVRSDPNKQRLKRKHGNTADAAELQISFL